MKLLNESIKVRLQVPRDVDSAWRALGWTEADYQKYFLDGLHGL